MKNIKIYIVLDVKKTHTISEDFEEFEDNFEYAKKYEDNNILIISLMELNKTQQEVPLFYYYKDLLFNLTKNKYVPHIEKLEAPEIKILQNFQKKI